MGCSHSAPRKKPYSRRTEKKKSPPDELDKLILSHNVLLISKTNCNKCLETKELLEEEGIDYALIELDTCPGFKPLGDILVSEYGQKTVPALFVNGKLIRGIDQLRKLRENGNLEALLNLDTTRSQDPSSPVTRQHTRLFRIVHFQNGQGTEKKSSKDSSSSISVQNDRSKIQ